MTLFESTEQYFLVVGINSNQTIQKNRLNVRNSMIMFYFGIAIGCDVSYVIYEAKSFQEYNISIYITSTLLVTLINFVYLIWKTPKVFEIFNCIEDIVNKSKLK